MDNRDEKILNAIIERFKQGKNILLTGEAGTGKTYTLNRFLNWMEEEGYKVALAGSTGISAINIGGNTVHRLFGINRSSNIEEFQELLKYDERARVNHLRRMKELLTCDLIVIDEISMIGSKLLELIDYILRKANDIDEPFGAMNVLFIGDFLQLPPVNDKFAFESDVWKEARMSLITLTEIKRQENIDFINILSKIRVGNIDSSVTSFIKERLYSGELEDDSTKLYARNASVDQENERILKKIDGTKKIYSGESNGESNDVSLLLKGINATEVLELKKGAKVMALVNDSELNYVNGSIGHVTKLKELSVEVTFENGIVEIIEPYTWESKDSNGNVKASFTQIPLRLAYAITMHKSQGMTIDGELFIDCSGIRSYGQFYVAMSRIKDPNKLKIINYKDNVVKTSPEAKMFYG